MQFQASVPPATEAFYRTWSRTDQPVASGAVDRTWIWGPAAFTDVMQEPYAEGPEGSRSVQYFDKARMEITDREADPQSTWFVTNGLLVVELMTGNMQVGHDQVDAREPASVNVAGDEDDLNIPTYATFSGLIDGPSLDEGAPVIQTLDRARTVGSDELLAEHSVTAGMLVPQTGHRVASMFWDFMNSEGIVIENQNQETGDLFANPFYATGYPLTEAFWVEGTVAGSQQWLLVQPFERRVLTYTPGNPDGFKVEAGNVGQHYYAWRYGDVPVYMHSPWWPYLSAHINDDDPAPVVGGPISVSVTQQDGVANWVPPGPRQLDPTIFGTSEDPKGTEIPPMVLGVPEAMRETLADGTQQTAGPTPFGDNFASTEGASIEMTAVDATATDAATTDDQVDFEARFQAPMEQGDYRVTVDMAAPHGWYHPTAGGVITNLIQHGVTKWGTQLMPTEYVDAAFWGMGDIYKDGQLLAQARLVHVMVTEMVRGDNYELAFDEDVDPGFRHLHLIVPPFSPFGTMSPVTTGFTLPNGMEQPFMHVMFPNIEMSGGRLPSASD